MERAYTATAEMTGKLQQLEDQQLALSNKRVKMDRDLARAREILNNESEYSAQERLKALRDVVKAEGEVAAEEIRLAQENANALAVIRDQDTAKSDEKKKAAQEAQNEVIKLETESILRTIKIKKQEAGLIKEINEQAAIDAEKAANDAIWRKEATSVKSIGITTELNDAIKINTDKTNKEVTENLNADFAERERLLKESKARQLEIEKQAAINQLKVNLGYAVEYAKIIGSLLGEVVSNGRKTLASFFRDATKALVQTIENAAIAALTKIIFAQIEAGASLNVPKFLAATAGIIAVKAVSSGIQSSLTPPKMARGGVFEGASHAGGGVALYANGRQIAEVEGGERFVVLNKRSSRELEALSSINKQYGGIDLNRTTNHAARGGQIDTSTPAAAIDYAQLAAALTSTNIFVRVTDINTAQNNRSRTIAAGVL